jgi:hypothetical protein
MKYFLSLISILIFVSCKKEANVKLPETKPLPVIYCYISPNDTIIRLKLTLSQPLYGTINTDLSKAINDANVSISSDQGNAGLTYNSLSRYYELSTAGYPVLFGKKYKVAVTLANGLYAESETTVPSDTVPILSASYETVTNNYQTYHRIKHTFKDDANAINYYCLMNTSVISFTSSYYGESSSHKFLYSDKDHNGELTELIQNGYNNSPSQVGYDLFLLNCNYDYYRFYKSLENYAEGDPFAEPSLTFTNVKGGFGVFAAYTLSTYRLNL